MKIENKFYATNYNIASPYFKSDLPDNKEKIGMTMMIASDIHYQTGVCRDLFRQLVSYARITQPDIIVIPGDVIETIDFIDNDENKNFFEKMISDLAEVAPVVIVPGNHEIGVFDKKNYISRLKNKDNKESNKENTKAINYFEKVIGKIKNVYFLNNVQETIKGVTFFGFNPRIGSYLKINDLKAEDEFIEDYIKCGFKMNESSYNVLLTHSNQQLLSKRVYDSMDGINLVDLSIHGHWHDAYLPKRLDKKYGDTNVGLFFTPLMFPYPGVICRGIHDFGRGYMFVSQGYRKWTADNIITNAFEKITANDVENLIISNGEKEVLDVSQSKPLM